MKRSEAEFSVVMLPNSTEERFFVDGKNQQSPISVNDLFQIAYRIPKLHADDAGATPVDARRISLRIEEIDANRKTVNSIQAGAIARLYLSGDGQELVRKGDVLGIEIESA